MDLGQLEAFVQVANQKSFSRAAEALFLTQPSVTARIQALERDLGERLFERSGRGVRLTEVGNCFLPHAEHVLQALHEGRDAIDALRNLQSGSLILASATTVSTYILPGVLKVLRSRDLRIPEDLSLVTVDEVRLLEFIEPPIAVVSREPLEIGREGASLLLRLLQGGEPEQVPIRTRFIPRASCAPPRVEVGR